jgi:hypothetical protein
MSKSDDCTTIDTDIKANKMGRNVSLSGRRAKRRTEKPCATVFM